MEWLKISSKWRYVCSLDGDLLMRVVDCSNRGDKVVLVFIQNIFYLLSILKYTCLPAVSELHVQDA
jgi:hypothetical protein